jgi:hypothetical protein
MVPGDVIWHCHLYPHFHHGMWGIFRTFNTLQVGESGAYFHGETGKPLAEDDPLLVPLPPGKFSPALRERQRLLRRLGHYPDLTPIRRLVPLPDREPPPHPTTERPGFPLAWPKGSEHGCTIFANYRGECGLHVHIVKFDPMACDGASTGWNYISSPRFGKKMVYRWWADEEFGTIFTHDHMFANFRQKHGLFGALLVEPENATFHHPQDLSQAILTGQNAVIAYQENGESRAYREFCLGNGDWVPLFKRAHHQEGALRRQKVPVPSDSWSGLSSHSRDGRKQDHGHSPQDPSSHSSCQSEDCCGPFVASTLVGAQGGGNTPSP